MNILSLDTSTMRLDAALVRICEEGSFNVAGSISFDNTKGMHSQLLPTILLELLKADNKSISELNCLAVGSGPGSFTGLRTGFATMSALSYGSRILFRSSSSLASMALLFARNTNPDFFHENPSRLIAPVLDARRGQIYAGLYRFMKTDPSDSRKIKPPSNSKFHSLKIHGTEYLMFSEKEDTVSDPSDFLESLSGKDFSMIGSGIGSYEILEKHPSARKGIADHPSAVDLALLCIPGKDERFSRKDLFSMQPSYVRSSI